MEEPKNYINDKIDEFMELLAKTYAEAITFLEFLHL